LFFLLSKTLDWLVSPLTWSLVSGALALAFARRRPRLALGLGALALLVLVFFSTEIVSNALSRAAERGAVRTVRPQVTYDAVIVLGGGLDPDATLSSGEPELNAAAERIVRGFEMLKSGWAQNVLLSAGKTNPDAAAIPEAVVLATQLEEWGIDGARIFPESLSRNTRENAVESAKIVRARGWSSLVLVTSAAHMPRALGCFHAVGLSPDALPIDYRSSDVSHGLAPRAGNLAASTDVIHELVGRAVYRALGYSVP